MQKEVKNKGAGHAPTFKKEAIEDYKIACISRETSLLGRKEVLGGKAKFGIFGDGKEVAQVAMARAFKNGDFRSGYYRDQTFVFAAGLGTVEQFFSQLYADVANDPFSAGRQMNAHFATPLVDENGQWLAQTATKNISADISPTAGQMARALGLAAASKQYRARINEQADLAENFANFSHSGNEVSFCTIGDASTSEGVFWETINAAGVTQVPLAVFVWDDGYGISVPIKYQTTKSSISDALAGMQSDHTTSDTIGKGLEIRRVKGWDYEDLRRVFADGIEDCRTNHAPYLFHVQELTQPQGHSTSGSHERYKSAERLLWEKEQDGIVKMRHWLLAENILTAAEATEIEEAAKKEVKAAARRALDKFNAPITARKAELLAFIDSLLGQNIDAQNTEALTTFRKEAAALHNPTNRDIMRLARLILRQLRHESANLVADLQNWLQKLMAQAEQDYTSHLYSENEFAAAHVAEIKPVFDDVQKNGFEILNTYFDQLFDARPEVVAFGEDVGQIGDVNQGFAGLQAKYGDTRIFDAGIREWTIIGQAIGMAMRGLRPIAEIQYLDYLIYALSPLSDDLATIRYRSAGIQQSPAIIRTRGHRLEGIWHSGSPIGMMLHSLRGICLLVPRDMTRAVGFYNTMLRSNDPAIIIECLNGYRLKEQLPTNLLEFTVPIGVVECLQTGTDITLVTYGSCVRVAQEAAADLAKLGISVEIIDCQSLLPFDTAKDIAKSLAKTNRLVVLDEDVPSGGAAYILDKVINEQKGYFSLDAQPLLITAKAVRPAYGSDADYIIKPSVEDVVEQVYALMHESRPADFSPIYRP
jgi:pyruvate/2-oxoglutarate/acetoin dehydrogenase E1 component/TPP-dependent pyruvate/acetoin dehydrogenase alpha subunit